MRMVVTGALVWSVSVAQWVVVSRNGQCSAHYHESSYYLEYSSCNVCIIQVNQAGGISIWVYNSCLPLSGHNNTPLRRHPDPHSTLENRGVKAELPNSDCPDGTDPRPRQLKTDSIVSIPASPRESLRKIDFDSVRAAPAVFSAN